MTADGRALLAALLRHEAKTNTYKFALVRALNDLALAYPLAADQDVVVPLRQVAQRWLVFFWPFVGAQPVYQGARAVRGGQVRQDISFRSELTELRQAWEALPSTRPDPADGALLLAASQVGRGQVPHDLQVQTERTLTSLARAVRQPVRYAGGGSHGLFGAPAPAGTLAGQALPVTRSDEPAFTVPAVLWRSLQELSLWVEVLCVHEWSLHVERVAQDPATTCGEVFALLSASPQARAPLTWERQQVQALMLGGQRFHCPWTGRRLDPSNFDLDHIIPVSVYPVHDLWNLVPSDPAHNMHVKRARIPAPVRLQQAAPHLTGTYVAYESGMATRSALHHDVAQRFGLSLSAPALTRAVITLSEAVAGARNVARY